MLFLTCLLLLLCNANPQLVIFPSCLTIVSFKMIQWAKFDTTCPCHLFSPTLDISQKKNSLVLLGLQPCFWLLFWTSYLCLWKYKIIMFLVLSMLFSRGSEFFSSASWILVYSFVVCFLSCTIFPSLISVFCYPFSLPSHVPVHTALHDANS